MCIYSDSGRERKIKFNQWKREKKWSNEYYFFYLDQQTIADTSKMKNKGFAKKNKKMKELKGKVKELELLGENLKKENERPEKNNKRIQIQNIVTAKQACKWYQQWKAFKTKYRKLKVIHMT